MVIVENLNGECYLKDIERNDYVNCDRVNGNGNGISFNVIDIIILIIVVFEGILFDLVCGIVVLE